MRDRCFPASCYACELLEATAELINLTGQAASELRSYRTHALIDAAALREPQNNHKYERASSPRCMTGVNAPAAVAVAP